ncbi:MAG: hypothetical protein HY829_15340 [Actinobacteria bacterium]|nr:hypothetical protein [Actinomycetota bacterium]
MSWLPGGDPRHDPRRTGLPIWAERDDGPLNTYVPGPLPSEPLESSYHAGVRLIVSGLVVAGVIAFVVANSRVGVVGSVLIVIGLWALYAVPVWLRGRLGLRVDGPRCEVRGRFRTVSFEGADVAKVQFLFAGRSPDVRLALRDGRKVMVATSQLERGHSTLYEWLRRYAPDATYDAKALDLRDTLVNRGLMGAPGEAWDGPMVQVRGGTGTAAGPSDTASAAAPDEATAPSSSETRTDHDEHS